MDKPPIFAHDSHHAANEKVPAVLCLPGKGKSKESAAGEPELHAAYGPSVTEERFVMALPFVRKGMIAVVVDNPGTAETSDLERYARTGYQSVLPNITVLLHPIQNMHTAIGTEAQITPIQFQQDTSYLVILITSAGISL